jgi:hypothetical protein
MARVHRGKILRSGEDRSEKTPKTSQPTQGSGKDRAVGDALRTVYRTAVEETVPDEMLDLLRKLD